MNTCKWRCNSMHS